MAINPMFSKFDQILGKTTPTPTDGAPATSRADEIRALAKKAQEKTTPQTPSLGSRISTDIQKRGDAYYGAITGTSEESKDENFITRGVQGAAQAFGGVMDIGSEILKSLNDNAKKASEKQNENLQKQGIKPATPITAPQGLKDYVENVKGGLGMANEELGTILNDWATKHPDAGKALVTALKTTGATGEIAGTIAMADVGGMGLNKVPVLGTKVEEIIPNTLETAKKVTNVTELIPSQEKAINQLEQTYSDIMSGTTPGKKNIAKIESKTEALNKAGTEGKTPMRTLAEDGVIPNQSGTKIDTFNQAQQYREKITPLRDANRLALKEAGLSTAPISLDALEAKAIEFARTPENINAGRFSSMQKDIQDSFKELRIHYPDGNIPLSIVDDIKSARWDNVFKNKGLIESDVLKKNSEYSIAKSMQKTIEETVTKAGNPEVAQLNRVIGDKLEASKFLEDLNGKTIKGGRLLKYLTTGIGASFGHTIPGKILGAMGGNLVGDLVLSNTIASPIKRFLLRNLEVTNPESYTKTIEWLSKQNLDRETRLLLPAPKEGALPLGGETFTGGKVDASGNPIIPTQQGARIVPAEKNPVSMNPQTGKFQTTYSSQEKSPTNQQTINATSKVSNIESSIPQPKPKVNMIQSAIEKYKTIPNKKGGFVTIDGKVFKQVAEATKKEMIQVIDYLRNGTTFPYAEDVLNKLALKYNISQDLSNNKMANHFQDLIEKTETTQLLVKKANKK